ncbi:MULTISPECIES: hypothetical protein [Mesorhizobium]|nr:MULTISPECIES: hypothetical protein [Mesorhizobium]
MMGSPDHAVEIIREKKWTVRVTAYGNTLTFPFEAESYARSYADGQAFRLGVEVAERMRLTPSDDYFSEGSGISSLLTK